MRLTSPESIGNVVISYRYLIVLVLALVSSVGAFATDPESEIATTSERVARARWQPIRQSVQESFEELPAPNQIPAEILPEEIGVNVDDGSWADDGSDYYDERYRQGAYYGDDLSGPGCGNNCTCGRCCRKPWMPLFCLGVPTDGWFSAEYLMWFQKGMYLPPLVTTSANPATPRAAAGVLGQQGTTTLFGGSDNYADETQNGLRLRLGFWLDSCHRWSIEGEHFALGTASDRFGATSTGDPILARPFFNVLNGGFDDSELVAFPGVVQGNVSVSVGSDLNGQSVHLRRLLCCGSGCAKGLCSCPSPYCSRLEGLIGWRRIELAESLIINEDLTDPATGIGFDITDSFRTNTHFNGVNLGILYRRQRGCWSLDLAGKIGVGSNQQTVTINGTTIQSQAGTNNPTQVGGLLAQRTNIGTYSRSRFSVLPEFDVNLGYNWTSNLRFTLGYTFIYWSNVVRPGDQIDLDVNPNLLPPENTTANPFGALRPAFAFQETDYWVQGLSLGMEYRF